MARPTKLTEDYIEAMEEVLEDDLNAIVYTDEELVDEINYRLPEDKQIHKTTFEKWKSKVNDGREDELGEMGECFYGLLKKALRRERKNLMDGMLEDNKWQRRAWILERKFDEWNLKHKKELEHSGGFNLTAVLKEVEEDEQEENEAGD